MPNGNGIYNGIARITPAGGQLLRPARELQFDRRLDARSGRQPVVHRSGRRRTHGEQPAVGEISPAGVITLHAILGTTLDPSLGVPANPTCITTGPTVRLVRGNGAIGRITTAGAIQQFPLPSPTATVRRRVWPGQARSGSPSKIPTCRIRGRFCLQIPAVPIIHRADRSPGSSPATSSSAFLVCLVGLRERVLSGRCEQPGFRPGWNALVRRHQRPGYVGYREVLDRWKARPLHSCQPLREPGRWPERPGLVPR